MLSPKHKVFVAEYLVDLNATQAAIRAGYSPKTAYSSGQRLLKHVEVAAAIAEKTGKRLEKLDASADYVIQTIAETVERCRQGVPVHDKQGNETGEWQFEPFAVLKGCELLGKHHKLFTEKVEHAGEIKHVDCSSLTDDQLRKVESILATVPQ